MTMRLEQLDVVKSTGSIKQNQHINGITVSSNSAYAY
jgi:hypothetical protein